MSALSKESTTRWRLPLPVIFESERLETHESVPSGKNQNQWAELLEFYRHLQNNMTSEHPCQCSVNVLEIMTELRNVHTVVDVETILDLVQRVCQQGNAIVNCKDCTKTPQSSIVTLPPLSEQCLPLFEAVCSAYNISTQPNLLDPTVLVFDQTPSPFICIRNKVILGQTELDEDETRLLVRTLVGRNLMKLVDLMEGLKGILRMLLENSHPQRAGAATLRACESSVQCIIGRLVVLMQQIEDECNTTFLP